MVVLLESKILPYSQFFNYVFLLYYIGFFRSYFKRLYSYAISTHSKIEKR